MVSRSQGRLRNRIEIRRLRFSEPGNGLLGRTAGDQRGSTRGVQQALGRKIVGIGIAGPLAGNNTDAATALTPWLADLPAILDADRGGRNRFEKRSA